MEATENSYSSTKRQAYTVDEVAKLLGVGRAAAYAAVRQNQIPAVRIGRLVRIPKRAFDRWLDGLEVRLVTELGSNDDAR